MINFRFHVVSLIAIFLALALGVVVGAGVIDRGVVDTLNSRLDRVEAKSDRIQLENDTLKAAQTRDAAFIQSMEPFALPGRLTGETVALIAVRGVDGDRVTRSIAAITEAGGQVSGILWLEAKFGLPGKDDAKTLATAIDDPTKRGTALRNAVWKRIASRFAKPPASETATDILTVLQDAGFVEYQQVDGGLTVTQFPGRDALTVLIVGEAGEVATADVVMPAATALSAEARPLVVGSVYADLETGPARGDGFDDLRASELSRTVSTVDDLDLAQGPTTLALVLADLTCVPPVVGHYGYGSDTVALPDPATSCRGVPTPAASR
jgi:hypothetical protein